jgi:S-adenosylmethionine:tRNA ribosyltransferase-isomerase
MHPKDISISEYTYILPEDRIAKFPLPERDQSKLLIYKNKKITQRNYKSIDEELPENSLLIFNNTKVVHARILFQKLSGGIIEIFCLEPAGENADISQSMLQTGKTVWKCLVGGVSKWKKGFTPEKETIIGDMQVIVSAAIKERLADYFIVELSWQPAAISFEEILHHCGEIPLPPYLHRSAEKTDEERYQTIYAEEEGSVAAPTAGLHFTNTIFEKLKTKNISTDFITLHVGAGTFKPVKAPVMEEHQMHAEYIHVTANTIENILNTLTNTIIAVGTTSLRTIETLYWLGLRTINDPLINLQELQLSQWEVYEQETKTVTAKEALQSLLIWMKKNKYPALFSKTQIIIAPGYNFKIIKGLITNFHQPQSTLLLLVAALIGKDWKDVYEYALKNEYRFLSYGDGCLLWEKNRSYLNLI